MRRLRTVSLSTRDISTLRYLFEAAWPDPRDPFTEEDWEHSTGGVHFLLEDAGEIVSHAAVVERELHVAGTPIRTGYVEAMATRPEHQRRGYGTAVMGEVNAYLDRSFRLGALGTGEIGFYERLGWQVWRGPTSVRTTDGEIRTPEDDGFVMVRTTPSSPALDLSAPISCDWRLGDVW
ncbi:MAG TPA: GNAT family N-acetyltransferase [Actinomycetota bacterium]|nr:GNAT family N-acetyltransferase [Actinomycetota bacterium]